MKRAVAVWLVAVASCAFAGTIAPSPLTSLQDMEKASDARLSADPWDFLGATRGVYLPGFGTIFTAELSLIHVPPLYPFKPSVSPEEVKAIHDQKAKQLPLLRNALRELMAKAATSLASQSTSEQIVFEVRLFAQPFEDHRGLPWRLTVTANHRSLLDAVNRHASSAEIAALITERTE